MSRNTLRRALTHACIQRRMSSTIKSQTEDSQPLFEYTSGRWLWNDNLRHRERSQVFNVAELQKLAAAAVQRSLEDITAFEKLAEGGFNRTFLVSMRDGFQMVARIAYPVTEPKRLVTASEVATMKYLHQHGIPVPRVYGHCSESDNPAGTEYIFMEYVTGTNLGDIWFEIGEGARMRAVAAIVKLEARLLSLQFPESGSLYDERDLAEDVGISTIPTNDRSYCIGPETTLSLWYGKRSEVAFDRGPYKNAVGALVAGANKETAYLQEYGKPLHPFQRMRREVVGYQRQSPDAHISHLSKFLHVAPYLVPDNNDEAMRPVIRHPDLQPNNIFVANDMSITAVIDWQHAAIRPLFLQGGIPKSLQNYGDSVSEFLETPRLPDEFESMSEMEQYNAIVLHRKRQLHHEYVLKTKELVPSHHMVLASGLGVLTRKLCGHATDPWEGDNVTLKADLIQLTKAWPKIAQAMGKDLPQSCPISFTDEEMAECERLSEAFATADSHYQAAADLIGVGPEGWMPIEAFEEVKQRERHLFHGSLEDAESPEDEREVRENWPFSDFDEQDYDQDTLQRSLL